MRSEGFFHLVEEESHALDCNNEVLRLRSFFDHVAPAFAFEDIGYRLPHLLPELSALDVLVPKRDAEAQDRGGGVVDIFIELLGP